MKKNHQFGLKFLLFCCVLIIILLTLLFVNMTLTDEQTAEIKKLKSQRTGVKGWLTRGRTTIDKLLDASPIDTVALKSNLQSY